MKHVLALATAVYHTRKMTKAVHQSRLWYVPRLHRAASFRPMRVSNVLFPDSVFSALQERVPLAWWCVRHGNWRARRTTSANTSVRLFRREAILCFAVSVLLEASAFLSRYAPQLSAYHCVFVQALYTGRHVYISVQKRQVCLSYFPCMAEI